MPTRTAVLHTVGACATSAALNVGVRTMPKRLSPSPAMGLFGRTAPVPEPLPEPEPETNSLGDLAQDVAIAVLRLGTCSLMYHHGIDKIQARAFPRVIAPQYAVASARRRHRARHQA